MLDVLNPDHPSQADTELDALLGLREFMLFIRTYLWYVSKTNFAFLTSVIKYLSPYDQS
jgi:hypothetical protein